LIFRGIVDIHASDRVVLRLRSLCQLDLISAAEKKQIPLPIVGRGGFISDHQTLGRPDAQSTGAVLDSLDGSCEQRNQITRDLRGEVIISDSIVEWMGTEVQ
jgi:hypothetical protein